MQGKCRRVPGCVNHSASETPFSPAARPRAARSPENDRASGRKGPRLRAGARLRIGLLSGLLGWVACSAIPPHPDVDAPEGTFSPALLRAHLAALEPLEPRFPGSRADEIARTYLERELELAGARVEVRLDGGRRHLVARIEGASRDRIQLVAPYPALASPLWVDDGGAVLLLELARVFGRSAPAYTLELALAEVQPTRIEDPQTGTDFTSDDRELDPRWVPLVSREEARQALVDAGESLVRVTAADDGPGRLRAVVVFDVSARGGVRLARDLRSHAGFRDLFWQTAAELGWTSTFPEEGHWASPIGLHTAFRGRTVDRVLALVDESTDASPTSPRAAALEPVGFVAVEALERLMERFQKVDAFAG